VGGARMSMSMCSARMALKAEGAAFKARGAVGRRGVSFTRVLATASADPAAFVAEAMARPGVVVFSKSYCPYCVEVKVIFKQLGVSTEVLELDQMGNGGAVQAAMAAACGARTVPQVFVGGKHIGGCDKTHAALKSGELKAALSAAGIHGQLGGISYLVGHH